MHFAAATVVRRTVWRLTEDLTGSLVRQGFEDAKIELRPIYKNIMIRFGENMKSIVGLTFMSQLYLRVLLGV